MKCRLLQRDFTAVWERNTNPTETCYRGEGDEEPDILTAELHTLQCARTQRNSAQEHSGTVQNSAEQCARTQRNSAQEHSGTVRKNTVEQCARTQRNSAEQCGTVRKNTAEQCGTVQNSAEQCARTQRNSAEQCGTVRKNTAEQCGTVQNSAEQCARTQRNSAEQRAMPFSYLLPALVSHCCVFAVFALLCVLLCVTPWSWRSSLGTGIRI
ncbi:uncharacterized protein LOC124379303 isoform X4 [Silurus meridionalis]|uniref:uncharacterized protein LOC124379303 isoform X4 n=1 Tax=Silurus meridionalis TaxID=175797 RepID=UPI001EE9DB67|nr:uncharacterized protein LOC124379303 isoform X4 [Silurus meridionalis]